jgi:hypothetical protein
MKRIILSMTLLFLICQHGITQSFTTTVTGAKIAGDLIYPLKATGSLQFTVTVKNDETLPNGNTYSVSIDKPGMLPLDSWIAIDVNSQSIAPQETKNYVLTLTIPAGQIDNNYSLPINLIATLSGVSHSVLGKTMTVIVDNSQPNYSQINFDNSTSNTIRVAFDGYDARSSFYTSANTASGYNGIKNFTLTLKNQAGTIVANPTVDAKAIPRAYSFPTLAPFTTYNASATAIDLAGNSKTSDVINVTTKPGAPTNLKVSSSSYCRISISWDAMPGATSYFVWIDPNTVFTATTPTYTFTGLTVGTAYTFNVRAVGIEGSGDITSKSFSTPAVSEPRFLGGLGICSSSQTIQVRAVSDAISYDWTVSSPLTINGAQSCTTTGNSVVVQTNGFQGSSEISVTANTSCGISSNTATGELRIGPPKIYSNYPLAIYDGSTYNNVCNLQNYSTSMNIQNADYVEWTRIAANPTSTSWYQSGANLNLYFFAVDQTAAFNVYASNTCGSLNNQFGFKSINCGGGGGCLVTYSAYPNPASQSTKVTPNIPAPCDPILQTAVINGTVSVYDKRGIKKKSLTYKGYQDMNIDVSDLKDGLYYINIFDGTTTSSVSLIVKH